MPKRISGPNTEEMTRKWRNFINEELHKFQSSTNIKVIKSGGGGDEMDRLCSTHGCIAVQLFILVTRE
jgi:hypothetical protein